MRDTLPDLREERTALLWLPCGVEEHPALSSFRKCTKWEGEERSIGERVRG